MGVSALGASALRSGGPLPRGARPAARALVSIALVCGLTPGEALAGGISTLEPVVVSGGPDEGLIGLAGAATEGTVGARQLERQHHVLEGSERGQELERLEHEADRFTTQCRARVLVQAEQVGAL